MKEASHFPGDGNQRLSFTKYVDVSGTGVGPFVPVFAELGGDYETVAAGQAAQVLGNTGGVGDYLEFVHITPLTNAPGAVTLTDGVQDFTLFAGGTLSELRPIVLAIRARSSVGAWKITTGANVAVLAVGRFS